MSDVVSKQDSRSQDRSKTKLRRKNSSSSSASGSGLSQKRRNACSKDKRNKSKQRRSSSSGSSSSSSTSSRGSSSRKQIKVKTGNIGMSQKYNQSSSRDRRNGVQVQGGRDNYVREQRSYSQRESRYKMERFDRTFSNRMYNDNNQGGMRGMKYAIIS